MNSRLSIIQEKAIRMDATAVVRRDVPFPGIDLSVLNGNLLDNVLEACMQMEGEETGGHAGVHGFGPARIDRIVSKYGGFLNRQDEEGVFVTEVMLRLVEG